MCGQKTFNGPLRIIKRLKANYSVKRYVSKKRNRRRTYRGKAFHITIRVNKM